MTEQLLLFEIPQMYPIRATNPVLNQYRLRINPTKCGIHYISRKIKPHGKRFGTFDFLGARLVCQRTSRKTFNKKSILIWSWDLVAPYYASYLRS